MKNILVLIILFVVPLPALAEYTTSCPKMSLANNCSFYDKCLETKNECGKEGYALNYGLKFCKQFKKMELSQKGEKWITDTMACLQENLNRFAFSETECSKIKEEAFKSHISCYIDKGFCGLDTKDKLEIIETNFWTTVTSYQGLSQGANTLLRCVIN